MTREERNVERAKRLKEKLADTRRELAQAEAKQRADERTKRSKRRLRIGTLADEAGLFVWEDGTIEVLLQTLGLLREAVDPVGVLTDALQGTLSIHTFVRQETYPTEGACHGAR